MSGVGDTRYVGATSYMSTALIKKPVSTKFAVLDEIDKAKKVFLFVHADYSDEVIPPSVRVSKQEARRIANMSYAKHPPRWKWSGEDLLVFPRYMEV